MYKYMQLQLTKTIRREVIQIRYTMHMYMYMYMYLPYNGHFRSLDHANVCRFIGATLRSSENVILTEYCPKGSLNDVLQNDGRN